jgi:hypothetical protein
MLPTPVPTPRGLRAAQHGEENGRSGFPERASGQLDEFLLFVRVDRQELRAIFSDDMRARISRTSRQSIRALVGFCEYEEMAHDLEFGAVELRHSDQMRQTQKRGL